MLGDAERHGRPEADDMRLCFEVLALASAIDRACAARLAPQRLSEGKFVLLLLLRDAPDGIAPHELASRAGVTRATVTGLLDGLERDGFLVRHDDRDDRRRVSVRLTEQGRTIAANLFVEHGQWIASLLAGVTPSERESVGALLRRVRDNLAMPAKDIPVMAIGDAQ
ncbi:MarR family transcriptional regulator [uncultured Sphingomonas sp.]|uniref:MarR family winged helix-turn-helix transcriptional regulator n=1 Tax=uncultured Sphingomonas sp. TaxID=158754 RepID=UPI0025CFAA7E|nr:MarR family transcriptional regulator [uncultured Sphingomonas sp.]